MRETLSLLVSQLERPEIVSSSVLRWGSPIPSFGDLSRSRVATLGLNPSDREFLSREGTELDGSGRRFHTLRSLELSRWNHATDSHLGLIEESCTEYFRRNPYHEWFRPLDSVIQGTGCSYYTDADPACHLDLVPYATDCKWTSLSTAQWRALLFHVGDTLGRLLRASPIRLLILNGASVVREFEALAGLSFERVRGPDWDLKRADGTSVKGWGFVMRLHEFAGIRLDKEVLALGYNHNIQSSFGITRNTQTSLRQWIARYAEDPE